jgi:DNA-binding NarL/FixJ family response regulator
MGEPSATEDRSGPVRVMLADNHAMFRQSVASMLAKDGEVVVVGDADNGPQAIEIAKQTRPEVIVMQVEQEPEEAATEIRGMLEASPDSRIVVLTAHQDPRMVRRMLQIGTSAYVHKSVTVEELLGTVRQATRDPSEDDGDFAVLGIAERMMDQVNKADDYGISARELEVLVLAGRGLSNRQIASRLHLSEATVKRHLANAYPKLGVSSRGEALSKGMGEGWITDRDIVGPEEG